MKIMSWKQNSLRNPNSHGQKWREKRRHADNHVVYLGMATRHRSFARKHRWRHAEFRAHFAWQRVQSASTYHSAFVPFTHEENSSTTTLPPILPPPHAANAPTTLPPTRPCGLGHSLVTRPLYLTVRRSKCPHCPPSHQTVWLRTLFSHSTFVSYSQTKQMPPLPSLPPDLVA